MLALAGLLCLAACDHNPNPLRSTTTLAFNGMFEVTAVQGPMPYMTRGEAKPFTLVYTSAADIVSGNLHLGTLSGTVSGPTSRVTGRLNGFGTSSIECDLSHMPVACTLTSGDTVQQGIVR